MYLFRISSPETTVGNEKKQKMEDIFMEERENSCNTNTVVDQ